MTLFFKKQSGANQKPISQQNAQSLIKKAVDGMSLKFGKYMDQIFQALKSQNGCEYVVTSLMNAIDQYADNDLAVFKILKVFYLCLISESPYFRRYALLCLPEIASISVLNFRTPTNNELRNSLRIFSQQIYLNLTLNTPLPSPKQLNLEKYIQSQTFQQLKKEAQSLKAEKDASLSNSESGSNTCKDDQIQKKVIDPPVPLSNCQFVENLIEWDIPEEKSPTNNNHITNFDDDSLFIPNSSNIKSPDSTTSDSNLNIELPLNNSTNTDVFQNTKDIAKNIPSSSTNSPVSITQSTPKLLDLIQQSPNDQFIPQVHKRAREKSYDPPKNDFDLFNDLKIVTNNLNIANNTLNTNNNIFNDINNLNKTNNNFVDNNDDIIRINKNDTHEKPNEIYDTSQISYFQSSNRSQSFHTFKNSKTPDNAPNCIDEVPLARQISSDSPSDNATNQFINNLDTPTQNSQNDYFQSTAQDIKKQQPTDNNQNISNYSIDNKTRSSSLELFPAHSSLPTKSTAQCPIKHTSIKAVRFPTSPNFKDIQNKASKSNNDQTVNFVNHKDNLDILDFQDSTNNKINKSNPTNEILDLSSSANTTSNINSTNSTIDIFELSNVKNTNSNKQNKSEFIDLSTSNSNNNEEFLDLSDTNIKNKEKNTDFLDLSDTNVKSKEKNTDFLDLSDTSTKNKEKNTDFLDISDVNSKNKIDFIDNTNRKSNNTDFLDLSNNTTKNDKELFNLSNKNLNKTSNEEFLDISNSNSNSEIIDLSDTKSSNKINSSEIIDLSDANNKSNNEFLNLSNTSNNTEILDLSEPVSPSNANLDNNGIDIFDLSSPVKNLNQSSNSDKSDRIDILDLSSNNENELSILELATNGPPNNSKSNLDQISTPPFINQPGTSKIPSFLNNDSINNTTTNYQSFIPQIGVHQRSFSNATPHPTSPIINSFSKTNNNISNYNDYDIGNEIQNIEISSSTTAYNSASANNTDSVSFIDDENIIPLIETKSKNQTIAMSAPYMMQGEIEVGNSSLLPTSDSPQFSQQKKRKISKKRSITINISGPIPSSSSFNDSSSSVSIRSIFSSASDSLSSHSFSNIFENNNDHRHHSHTFMQGSVLETIMEEDEANGQFVPISPQSSLTTILADDNFEPIPLNDENNGGIDDNFEPISIDEPNNNKIDNINENESMVEFVPISPRENEEGNENSSMNANAGNEGEVVVDDDKFEPINNDEDDQDSNNSVGSDDGDYLNTNQFEPITKEENIDNIGGGNESIYDTFEPINMNNFEPISNTKQTTNIDDGFEPISVNDDNLNQFGIDNDGFEPIGIDNEQQQQQEEPSYKNINIGNFEPLKTNNVDDNFVPINNENEVVLDRNNQVDSTSNFIRSNTNIKFGGVASDGILINPNSESIVLQARTKKYRVKKISSLQNIPAINLEAEYSREQNSKIITETNS